jgi:hypothetical protein
MYVDLGTNKLHGNQNNLLHSDASCLVNRVVNIIVKVSNRSSQLSYTKKMSQPE